MAEDFIDPFCGSGTIAIEAADRIEHCSVPGVCLMQKNGVGPFLAPEQKKASLLQKSRKSCRSSDLDLDPGCVELTKENAKRAGVDKYIEFAVRTR